MKFITTAIEGLIILEPVLFLDERGTFTEFYHKQKFSDHGIAADFVQDNESVSRKGVIRGLHFQEDPFAQGKLVKVSSGRALDVAVDLRKDSVTFGQSFSIELSSENNKMLWIPPGFAHGFEALSEQVVFNYKVTNYYHQSSERGILYNDPDLGIPWVTKNPVISRKDLELPRLSQYSNQPLK